MFVTHNGTVEWESLAWAGVLLGGADARLGETAAGYAHRLLEDAPTPVAVLVPHASPARSRSFWTVVQERPGVRDPRCTGSPPRILAPDTVLEVGEGAESPLELRYLRLERHGLPGGKRQRRTGTPGRRDVIYREYGLIVELDGRKGHDGEGKFRDMARDNAALLEQLLTMRFGFGDVAGSPCVVAAQVAQVLGQRGWTGPFRRCPACPRRWP